MTEYMVIVRGEKDLQMEDRSSVKRCQILRILCIYRQYKTNGFIVKTLPRARFRECGNSPTVIANDVKKEM